MSENSLPLPGSADEKISEENLTSESQEDEFSSISSDSSEKEELFNLNMENSMRIPQGLVFEGNMKERWEKWRQRFKLYLVATGLQEISEERQVAVLLNLIG